MARVNDCPRCGGALYLPELRDVPLRDLAGVVLRGMNTHACSVCGATGHEIPKLEGLFDCVVLALVGKPSRLAGKEVRLLRNHLDWGSEECAHKLGVTLETLSRWEHEHQPVNAIADRFLRSLVLVKMGVPAPVALLDLDFPAPAVPLQAEARFDGVAWTVVASDEAVQDAIVEAGRRYSQPAGTPAEP